MPHHFSQQRPRETGESVPWTTARVVYVWNFLGSDPNVVVANQVEPGDRALNEDGDEWFWTGLAWTQVDQTAHSEDHDHTATAGDGGELTNDEHDGYSEYDEIGTPSNPEQNSFRFFARASGDSIQIVVRSSQGQEKILALLLDAPSTTGKGLLLRGVKSA